MKFKNTILYSLLIIICLSLLGCSSSPTNGISKGIYNDGLSLVKAISKDLDENNSNDVSDEVDNQTKKFMFKYDNKDLSGKDSDFYDDMVIMGGNYMNYKDSGDLDSLNTTYEYIEKLNKDYDLGL